MSKFKIGDKVRATIGVDGIFGELGIIVDTDRDNGQWLVQFYNDIDGHDGNSFTTSGKTYLNGHCWYLDSTDLELIELKVKKQVNSQKPQESKYKVIFNDPATILFVDGEKYVTKAYMDEFNPEVGLAFCLLKSFGISYLDLKRMIKNATVQEKKQDNRQTTEKKVTSEDVIRAINSCEFESNIPFIFNDPKPSQKFQAGDKVKVLKVNGTFNPDILSMVGGVYEVKSRSYKDMVKVYNADKSRFYTFRTDELELYTEPVKRGRGRPRKSV